MQNINEKTLLQLLSNYCNVVKQGMTVRWKMFSIDLSCGEFFEVIGGLISRQGSLSIQLAMNPGNWNQCIAPLIYRAQIDAYITLAWILEKDCFERAQKYVMYGLGQEKLQIEHLQQYITKAPEEEKELMQNFIDFRKDWLNAQRFEFLTEVDIGSWSSKTTREMAGEASCLDLYHYAYVPFSTAVHSMWPHVARYDLKICKNPLHKKHRIPVIRKYQSDVEELLLSAKYVEKTYFLIDKKLKISCHVPMPRKYLLNSLRQLG